MDDKMDIEWRWNEKWNGTKGPQGQWIFIATENRERWVGLGNLASCDRALKFLLLMNTKAEEHGIFHNMLHYNVL